MALLFANPAGATIYFYYDAESDAVGATLPNPRWGPARFCQTECSGTGSKGYIASSGGAPQGSKYFMWETVAGQKGHYTEIQSDFAPASGSGITVQMGGKYYVVATSSAVGGSLPATLRMGGTYYLAFYSRFDRINGQDIWHEEREGQSADKGVEVIGPDIRLMASRGQWEHMAANQDHHYTIYTNVLRAENSSSTFGHNRNGYTAENPYQCAYERWYSVVLGFTLSNTGTGSTRLWINGVLVEEVTGINTVAPGGSTLVGRIQMGGTIAQPHYDAPPHYRKFDALLLTDNWQDIQSRGYLRDPQP